MWSLRCMQESKMRIHLVRLVKIWAEQEEQDFICILMYVNSILRKERGEKNTSMHLEQCSKCGNWETCVRSETGLWGLVSIQKQGSKNPNWLSFLVFCFFFLFLPCFQNVRFWSWQQKDTIQMQVHLCAKELFLSSSSLPLLLTCSMWCCISCALKIVCVPWQRRLKGT